MSGFEELLVRGTVSSEDGDGKGGVGGASSVVRISLKHNVRVIFFNGVSYPTLKLFFYYSQRYESRKPGTYSSCK